MKRTKNRKKKPKALRFSRYFLRGLLGCSLAAGIFAAYTLNAFRREHEGDADETQQWFEKYRLDDEEMQRYVNFPAGTQLTNEEFEAQYGISRMSYMLTSITDSNNLLSIGYGQDEYTAMLLDPETGVYYLPKQTGKIYVDGGSEYSQVGHGIVWLSDEAEAERLIKVHRDYSRSVETKTLFGDYIPALLKSILPFGGLGNTLGEKFEDWLRDDESEYIPVAVNSAYVKEHQCRGVTYQLPDGTVISPEEEMPAPWKLLKSRRGMTEAELDVIDDDGIDNAEKPEYISIGCLLVHGLPTDAAVNKVMQEITAELTETLPEFQQKQKEYRDIINDKSGVKREAYYREQMDIWGDAVNIQTPEERLESLNKRIMSLPESMCSRVIWTVEDAEQNNLTSTSCLSADEWESLRYGSRNITLGGKDYGLLYLLKVGNAWDYYRPIIIFNCILLFVGAVPLALILALIPYLRAKRRYARDEYRRSLTASLAHDLKSPLTAISGYAENLASGVHPEKQEHYAESIQDSTRYMDSVITNVLDLAKLEQDETAKKTAVNLIALAKAHLAHRGDEIAARNMQVEILGEYTVRADQRMLSQAIQNLLDNAFKFTPDGGSIRITGDGKALRITNSIAEERIPDVERLCEAFVKGDSARSNQSGSGLGLSVVRQAARLNRLHFKVQSSNHQFITTLSGGRRAESRAERNANRITKTDLTALVKAQLQAQEAEFSARSLKSKVTGVCVLYARPLDMETVAEAAVTLALRMMPDEGTLSVTGEGNALRICFPADRTRIGSDELTALLGQMRKKVRRSKLQFASGEKTGQMTLTVSEKPLLFRPIRLRKR